jgi:glycosyltransferase involved in cell wall biosynthesis
VSTLALNIIVGAGESAELYHCLSTFRARETFDEIVICQTATDDAVKAVCDDFGAKVVTFEWKTPEHPFGDFAGARNTALHATTSDYVMWLDADDMCLEQYQEKLITVRDIVRDDKNSEVDAYFMRYDIISEIDGTPTTVFWRDRIFKRGPRFRWERAVHEFSCRDWTNIVHGKINNMAVTHEPQKPNYVSAMRNVAILEHEYKVKKDMSHETRYFLGRDLLCCGREAEGLALFEELLCDQEASPENMYLMCITAAFYMAYGAHITRPGIGDVVETALTDAERWARLSLGMDNRYAEPYVILGDVYMKRGLVDAAERMYSIALKKKLNAGTLQNVPFYEEVPAERLSDIYIMRNQLEKALWYNSRSMAHNPGCEYCKSMRKKMLEVLVSKCD